MTQKNLHFCPNRNEYVSLKEGFEKCIESHQCFDDEPCPLHATFKATKTAQVTLRKYPVKPKDPTK